MSDLYSNIRRRREELGMTQDELAQLVGYKSRSSVNKIEMGENDIPLSKIVEFAKALHTTPSRLMGWEDENETADVVSDGDAEWLDTPFCAGGI